MQLFYEKYYGKGVVNSLVKVVTRLMANLGRTKKQPVVAGSQQVVTLSTQQLSYAQIIAFIEQNQGKNKVKIEHPTLNIVV